MSEELTLFERVLADLKQIRKIRDGVSVEAIARTKVICPLLGGGDPYIAYNRLMHRLLDTEHDITIKAAAASLGFASDGRNHLERLDEFGLKVGLDQRQVRRHSDRGLETIAAMISTNWPTESVPELKVVLSQAVDAIDVMISTHHLSVVAMRPPTITLVDHAGQGRELRYVADGREDEMWNDTWLRRSVNLARVPGGLALNVSWRGELWPRFVVDLHDSTLSAARVCSLGNRLQITFA